MQLCPCQSRLFYQDCCQPLHLGKVAETAEQLMRSRYSAYVQHNIDYLVKTTVPKQQALLDISAMRSWSETTDWKGLDIVAHYPNLSKTHSIVVFNAYFQTPDGLKSHHETSLFVQINHHWYFVDPTVAFPRLKQPCICGSGKKFKTCCGRFFE